MLLKLNVRCKVAGNSLLHRTCFMPELLFAVQENGRIIVREEKSGEVHLIAEDLIPEDMANYTCKSSNKGGLAEKNGTITVNCECL